MVGFKIKVTVDKSSLNALLKKHRKLVQDNIVAVLKKKALPTLIEMIMEGYDGLSEHADMLPDDPTNPANWRAEFLIKLHEDVLRTFVIISNRISVNLGDKDFLGYDPSGVAPDDTEPLHWMVFFLEGLIGDWAFIGPETYEILTKGAAYNPKWGRFSEGFMISKEDYEANNWNLIMPFSQVRHPFSGFSPMDIFAEAVREFNIRPFIQQALDAVAEGRKL